MFALTLAITAERWSVLHALDHAPGARSRTAVLVVASATATVTRYVGLKTWVFANRRRAAASSVACSEPATSSPLPTPR